MNRIQKVIEKTNIEYTSNPSLYIGDSGLLLFRVLNDQDLGHITEDIEEILGSNHNLASICSGKAGVNWLFTYLHKEYSLFDIDTLNEIRKDDEYLKNISLSQLSEGNYDFMHGALGISYYLLYDSNGIDSEYHTQILKLLEEQYRRDGKFFYRSSYDDTPEIRKVSLGLSHGLPSILRYVAECYKHGIAEELSKNLAFKLIDELKSYKNKDVKHGHFPTIVNIDQGLSDSPSRLAWCYGDPGIGIVLFHTGKILGDIELEKYGEQVLLDTVDRKSIVESMICDAGICHGAAGLVQIYNRMWLTTKNERFKEAAEHWINIAISLSQVEDEKHEFKRYNKSEEKWETSHSLLEGNAGVGLAFYSFLAGDCSWDYCLMLNE